ncbi:hypothetical protein ACFV1L_10750 [Kitasatospora sp. NPDC059646]|uniref:hypothetical protein n=1 Tax=Kitasatospora sp. NPDC059646 TaxID=3346893 RepID=UPI0036BB5E85
MAQGVLTAERVTIAGAEPADEVGFDRVTVARAARRLGVTDASRYPHVRSLEDLRGLIALLAADEKTVRLAEQTAGQAGRDALAASANAWREAVRRPGSRGGFAQPCLPELSRTRALDALRSLLEHWPPSREGEPA